MATRVRYLWFSSLEIFFNGAMEGGRDGGGTHNLDNHNQASISSNTHLDLIKCSCFMSSGGTCVDRGLNTNCLEVIMRRDTLVLKVYRTLEKSSGSSFHQEI